MLGGKLYPGLTKDLALEHMLGMSRRFRVQRAMNPAKCQHPEIGPLVYAANYISLTDDYEFITGLTTALLFSSAL